MDGQRLPPPPPGQRTAILVQLSRESDDIKQSDHFRDHSTGPSEESFDGIAVAIEVAERTRSHSRHRGYSKKFGIVLGREKKYY